MIAVNRVADPSGNLVIAREPPTVRARLRLERNLDVAADDAVRHLRVLVFEGYRPHTIADGEGLPVPHALPGGCDQRRLLGQPVVGVNAAVEQQPDQRVIDGAAEFGPLADLQLIVAALSLARKCSGIDGKGRVDRRTGHHLAALGETDDQVVDVSAFSSAVDGLVVEAHRRFSLPANGASANAPAASWRSWSWNNCDTSGLA